MDAWLTQTFLDGVVAVGFGAIVLGLLRGLLHAFGGDSPGATPRSDVRARLAIREAVVRARAAWITRIQSLVPA